jgi:serine protease Do
MNYHHSRLALAMVLIATLALAGSVGAQADPPTPPSAPGVPGEPLNGGALETLFPFPQEFLEGVAGSNAGTGRTTYSRYTRVTDDHEMLTVNIPYEWRDIDMGPWMYQGEDVGVFIAASTDLDKFYGRQREPGVFIGAMRASPEAILAVEQNAHSRHCKKSGRFNYKDPFYAGLYDLYTDCIRRGGHQYIVAAAAPADGAYLILIRISVVSQADLEAATKIFESFQMVSNRRLLTEDARQHNHDLLH